MEIVPRLSHGVCSHLAPQIMLSTHLDFKRALALSVLTFRLLNRARMERGHILISNGRSRVEHPHI